ncbi:TonB-linked outer membrane protein, SusC/RagA family [Filimonas lacunae]|uniref:TonB-linked outer membrane protein, SusC/RagA family n=1 Tax=Filimonas lacunae TaxID=477680 RepID=A0A1N7L7E4_9BACT|nr:SusC/RagA family TonB-linked outer membrane protein [Filimonas lacunae]SIS69701.1 TonB-linked outer membrane protein, SusC/RagA family [Filimonas lacunae]
MRKLLMFVVMSLILVQAWAQNRTVTGKITDEKGAPLGGVTITALGADKKVIVTAVSAANGSFSISVPENARLFQISYVGYEEQLVAVGNKPTLEVKLNAGGASLAEVVVVGYGVQQKKNFTGSASKIEPTEFSNLLSPSVDKQLAGRAAGVQVTTVGGSVNTPARIRIRGVQSLSNSNDPLIVVDGVPIISGNLSAATNSNTLGDINPSDIESMDILKDGSATAIYGSRAAGGVILITTKKGVRGRAKVNYDGFVGFSSALKKFSLLNAKQFETIANEKLSNAGLAARAGVNASADTVDTDWQGTVMIKNALSQSHTLSLQGGGDKTTYYFSANYSNNKGIIISNYNRAYRIRMNVDHEINKYVKIGNGINISRQEDGDQNNGSSSLGGAIAAALRLLPNTSPYSATGMDGYNINYPTSGSMTPGANSQTVDDNFNNVAYTLRKNKYYSDKYRIMDNMYLEVSPAKGLKVRSQVGIDMLNDYSYQGLNIYHGDGYGTGETYNAAQNWLRLLWTNYFNYNLSIKDHNFYLTGGYEVQKQTYKWFSADGTVLSDAFYINENVISNAASTQKILGNYDKTGFLSTFGRLNYDFKNRYFIQATFRRDGQSALAKGNQYGTFPGYSVGWRPSREAFWLNSPFLSKWFNEVKLKGSYAKVGNTLTGYPYLSQFGNRPYGNVSGIAPTSIGNPNLKWETNGKYDVGIDLSILKNRFTITADWFLNDVNNLVLDVPTPLSAGVPGSTGTSGGSISTNVGKLQNKGIEISISGNILNTKSGFTWDASFNYSQVKNKIQSLYPVGGKPVQSIENGNYNIIRVGDPMNIIYGYRYAGVNSANGNPMWFKADGSMVQLSLTPGSTAGGFYVANSKADGTLGAASSLAAADKTNLGQGIPVWFGGFSNTFSYKGITLDIMLRYSGGNKIMNVTRQDALNNMSFQNNGTEVLDRWTTAGQVTDVPKLYYGQAANMNSSNAASSRFVESGNYLRLQNVVLSYSLPAKVLEHGTGGYIKSLKIFAQGQNLHVWTKYKGADPDNISATGVDAAVAPQVRTISFGLSAGF